MFRPLPDLPYGPTLKASSCSGWLNYLANAICYDRRGQLFIARDLPAKSCLYPHTAPEAVKNQCMHTMSTPPQNRKSGVFLGNDDGLAFDDSDVLDRCVCGRRLGISPRLDKVLLRLVSVVTVAVDTFPMKVRREADHVTPDVLPVQAVIAPAKCLLNFAPRVRAYWQCGSRGGEGGASRIAMSSAAGARCISFGPWEQLHHGLLFFLPLQTLCYIRAQSGNNSHRCFVKKIDSVALK